MRVTYTVEVPFPNDCAPFKVIRRCGCGRASIFAAAQTREAAEAKARRLNDLEDEAERYTRKDEGDGTNPDYVPPAPRCPNTPDLFRFS
jgi:hypothetical protein